MLATNSDARAQGSKELMKACRDLVAFWSLVRLTRRIHRACIGCCNHLRTIDIIIVDKRKLLFWSLTNILANLGLPSFDTLMANATVSYAGLCTSCTNSLVMHLRQLSLFSDLCSFLLYIFYFSFCVFMCVCAFMSFLLSVVLYALLPELKGKK